MLIQCTKKLLDQLKIKPEVASEEETALTSWHANIITIMRRKTVVLVNDKNRYVIVLFGLKAKDFKNFNTLVVQAIRNTFTEENIQQSVIDDFLENASTITYTKTKDRKSVARMNKGCDYVYFYERDIDQSSIFQPIVSMKASGELVGEGMKNAIRPNEEMFQDLADYTGKKVFEVKAYVMKVFLHLENHEVWRRLVVPANMTFAQFHNALQIAFDWEDYHLHEFYIYMNADKKEFTWTKNPYHPDGHHPVINLLCDEESFGYRDEDDLPAKLDKDVRLEEYLPARGKYVYDFGDNWEHYFEVEREIEDFDKNYPQCLELKGETPPEDVGGEGGYEHYLEVIANKDHPDYEHFMQWGKRNLYRDYNIGVINRRLKWDR
ncbi:hypothetical protein CIB95_11785 [Lottiidibacillus patelloidae]|uniref:TnpR protein n=1 Tax=Lottiidibacillus patelloidae TaxID=2670334 RepID=A0A263BRW4_9BACI|nr:plasmid pRiA4b ORF-3 family protein [Lottiidibacillus patelloidae]OZM56449.1 hypothetical protein CIB95_11785 [Lottiidibacillus patelloidae]